MKKLISWYRRSNNNNNNTNNNNNSSSSPSLVDHNHGGDNIDDAHPYGPLKRGGSSSKIKDNDGGEEKVGTGLNNNGNHSVASSSANGAHHTRPKTLFIFNNILRRESSSGLGLGFGGLASPNSKTGGGGKSNNNNRRRTNASTGNLDQQLSPSSLVDWSSMPNPFPELTTALNEEEVKRENEERRRREEQELLEAYEGSEIHTAAILGDVERMKSLIDDLVALKKDQYADLKDEERDQIITRFCSSKKGKMENTPLHVATFKGQLQVVTFLVEQCNVDVNEVNNEGATSLHCACAKNHRSLAQYLMVNGADMKLRDQFGYSPLHIALKTASLDIADDLLLAGAEIDYKRFDGRTALHIMAEQGSIEGVKFLLEKHESTAALTQDQKGNIPLVGAIKKNQTEIVRYLCSYHKKKRNIAQVLRQKNELGRNVVHVAVDDLDKEENAYAMVRVIMESLFDEQTMELVKNLLNEADKVCKYTPLHCAVRRNYPHVVKLLLRTGCDVNASDEKGNTPLHLALANKNNRQKQEVFDSAQLLTIQHLIEHPRSKTDRKNNGKQTAKAIIKASKNDKWKSLLKNQRKLRREAASYYL